jgi:hypothetical protein
LLTQKQKDNEAGLRVEVYFVVCHTIDTLFICLETNNMAVATTRKRKLTIAASVATATAATTATTAATATTATTFSSNIPVTPAHIEWRL